MAFANQVVSEVLTPEEMSKKRRNGELIEADGDHIFFVEVLSGAYPKFEKAFAYELRDEFEKKKSTHDELLKYCQRSSIGRMSNFFKERNIEGEDFSCKIIREKPRDIVYVAKGESKDPNNDFSVIYIVREVRVGRWKFSLIYLSEASKITQKRQDGLIDDLINLPTANDWIANNRKKGL